jgi:formylglycine-generating enzyme required for sulfatase activity
MDRARLTLDRVPETDRVSSGGFWSSVPKSARVADRVGDDPVYRNDILGFRLVRDQECEWKKSD